MCSCFVAQLDIRDAEDYERYLAGFAEHDGGILAVDDRVATLEGECTGARALTSGRARSR